MFSAIVPSTRTKTLFAGLVAAHSFGSMARCRRRAAGMSFGRFVIRSKRRT
jgi:hypothetical protein